jgi:hypothetical protein
MLHKILNKKILKKKKTKKTRLVLILQCKKISFFFHTWLFKTFDVHTQSQQLYKFKKIAFYKKKKKHFDYNTLYLTLKKKDEW